MSTAEAKGAGARAQAAAERKGPAQPKPLAVCGVNCPYTRALILKTITPHFRTLERERQVVSEDGDDSASGSSGGTERKAGAAETSEFECDWDGVTLQWDEFERVEWDRVLRGQFMANSYLVRKGLIRKAQLAFNLRKWAAKHPRSVLQRAVPETHMFEVDHPDYLDEALADVHE